MPRRKKNARSYAQKKHSRPAASHISYIPKLEGSAECKAWLSRYDKRGGKVNRMQMKSDASGNVSGNLKEKITAVHRAEIWYADLGSNTAVSVQCGSRPVLIVSNEENNLHSSTVTVIPLTTRMKKIYQKTHVMLKNADGNPLAHQSMALAEQIITIDKAMLINCVGRLEQPDTMKQIEDAIRLQTGC